MDVMALSGRAREREATRMERTTTMIGGKTSYVHVRSTTCPCAHALNMNQDARGFVGG